MKTRRQANATFWAALLALAVLPGLARAQGISVAVGNMVPVTNVLGRTLVGNNGDPDNSCAVEIRRTWTGGIILAPTNDPAQLEAFNSQITNSHLGRGVVGVNPGTYAETFENRALLATNQQYYVRVFNRPNPQEAIYYADTPPFYGPPESVPSLNPEFGPLVRVDGEADVDTDGDGLPDALEDSETGTYPSEGDTDGDGYNDWFEALYGGYMDPLDPKEAPIVLEIHSPEEPGTGPRTVSWWTLPVPGLTYRLGYRPEWVDTHGYEEVWSDAATSNAYLEIDVEDVVTNEPVKGFFRVTVPYNGP